MTNYEVTFTVWAESKEEAIKIVGDGEAENPHVQESDDQDPPAWYLESKTQR